jgi:hypothetical protein
VNRNDSIVKRLIQEVNTRAEKKKMRGTNDSISAADPKAFSSLAQLSNGTFLFNLRVKPVRVPAGLRMTRNAHGRLL